MGGAAKRMMHPYDNLDLTFANMIDMLKGVSHNTIQCTEKFDGTNLVWSTDKEGNPRFARRQHQTVEGSMSYDEFIEELKGHPAEHIFSAGARAIKELTTAHGSPTVFEDNTWVNCEILLKDNPQMIRYDNDAVVLHNLSRPAYDEKGKLYLENVTEAYRRKWELFIMRSRLLGLRNWKVYGPQTVKAKVDVQAFVDARNELDLLSLREGLSIKNTVRDFLFETTRRALITLAAIDDDDAVLLAENVAHGGKHKIRDIKSRYSDYACKWIDTIALSKNRDKWKSSALMPIKKCWEKFGASVLASSDSKLIKDSDQARRRIHDLVEWNRTMLDSEYRESHAKVRTNFYENLRRFEKLKVEPPVSEGLVFPFDNNTYKITGAFPSLNRVTGAVRYEIGVMYNEKDSY